MKRSLLHLAIGLLLAACGGSSSAPTTAPTVTEPTTVATTQAAEAPTSATTGATTATTAATTTTSIVDDTLVIEVSVTNGAVAGESRVPVEVGADVRVIVSADVADEVHIHGYDIVGEVAAGAPATIEFVADIPGIFEVELEGARLELFELVVGG